MVGWLTGTRFTMITPRTTLKPGTQRLISAWSGVKPTALPVRMAYRPSPAGARAARAQDRPQAKAEPRSLRAAVIEQDQSDEDCPQREGRMPERFRPPICQQSNLRHAHHRRQVHVAPFTEGEHEADGGLADRHEVHDGRAKDLAQARHNAVDQRLERLEAHRLPVRMA